GKAPVDGKVHRGWGGAPPGAERDRRLWRQCRDRAVQDRNHLEVHTRLALCALCRGTALDRVVLRARLLPFPVSARWCAGFLCLSAPEHLSQSPPVMRKSLPFVRAFVSVAGY